MYIRIIRTFKTVRQGDGSLVAFTIICYNIRRKGIKGE